MNDLSTDIGSQIGALELGDHQEGHGDSTLEAVGARMAGPTAGMATCRSQPCRANIDDGALESVGMNMGQFGPLIPTARTPTVTYQFQIDNATQ
jgi:hypothetical protein